MKALTGHRQQIKLLLLTLVAICMALFSQSSLASISCETSFGEKSFIIEENTIAFEQNSEQGRSISSVLNTATRKTHTGFRKILYVNGNKYLIHIENQKSFTDLEDYMAVTSPKGHKMTYPITCSSLI